MSASYLCSSWAADELTYQVCELGRCLRCDHWIPCRRRQLVWSLLMFFSLYHESHFALKMSCLWSLIVEWVVAQYQHAPFYELLHNETSISSTCFLLLLLIHVVHSMVSAAGNSIPGLTALLIFDQISCAWFWKSSLAQNAFYCNGPYVVIVQEISLFGSQSTKERRQLPLQL